MKTYLVIAERSVPSIYGIFHPGTVVHLDPEQEWVGKWVEAKLLSEVGSSILPESAVEDTTSPSWEGDDKSNEGDGGFIPPTENKKKKGS